MGSATQTPSISGCFRISADLPPSTAERKTLASATSFAAVLSPCFEVVQNFLLDHPPLAHLAPDFIGEQGKQFALQVQRWSAVRPGKIHLDQAPPARDQYRVFGAQNACCLVPEFANSADPHAVTLVTSIAAGDAPAALSISVPSVLLCLRIRKGISGTDGTFSDLLRDAFRRPQQRASVVPSLFRYGLPIYAMQSISTFMTGLANFASTVVRAGFASPKNSA